MKGTGIKKYEFDRLKAVAGIVHGVFTRSGGTSEEPFDSLNIGINSGDKAAVIEQNRKLIIREMGMKPLVFLNQVHKDEIKILKKEDREFAVRFEPGKDLYTADGIITDMKGVFLVIQVADCQAVMMHDPVQKVIANIHSGWRGSIKNIVGKAVTAMVEHFGCRPEDILAGISPSLGPCCAEFINYKEELPKELWKYQTPKENYFDFWQMSVDQLTDQGVKKENIERMGICTMCSTNEFYSYRKEKTTGRFACVIALN